MPVRPARYYDPDEPELILSVACHLDLLGFKGRVSQGRTKSARQTHLRELKLALDEAYGALRRNSRSDWDSTSNFEVRTFSDNVLMGRPVKYIGEDGEFELGDTLGIVAEYQARLARHGFLVRGGLAFGELYIDENIIDGEALVEAVLEDKKGAPPRVSLSPSASSIVRKYQSYYSGGRSGFNSTLLVDILREEIFINYLDTAFDYFEESGEFDQVLLQRHLHIIQNGLKSKDSSVREKHRWLSAYHDYVISSFLAPWQQYLSRVELSEADPQTASLAAAALEARRFLTHHPAGLERPSFVTLVEFSPDAKLGGSANA